MKKYKKYILLSIVFVMIFVACAFCANAERAIVDSGNCGTQGDNVTWVLYDDGELVISGSGNMDSAEEMEPLFGTASYISKITIENGITSIGERSFAFYDFASISIADSVKEIGFGAFEYCSSLKSIAIPDSVEKIGSRTFYECNNLEHITIGSGLTVIGAQTFIGCNNLKNIYVSEKNEKFSNDSSGVLFNKDKSVLVRYPAGKDGDYEIPEGVITIGKEAFNYSKKLSYVIVPDSTINIEEDAFSECIDLEKISMGSGIKTIGEDAFYWCRKLSEVSIPEGVVKINKSVFSWCDNLNSVTISKNITYICESAFYACVNLKDVYYGGTEQKWNEITIESDNYNLLDATIHFNYNANESHIHTLKTATFPATCIASGMTYSYCTSCGDTVGETTIIPALGHKVGNWETVTEPTTENEGKKIQTCSVCGEKLCEEIIPKLEIIIAEDKKTGVSLEVEKDSVDGEVEIRVEESHDGVAFNLIDDELSVIQSFIYDIKMIVDGTETQPNGKLKVKIPVPEGYIPERTRVFHVNTKTGKVENMNAVYEDGYMVFKTDHFSYYALVEEADVKNCSCNCHKGGIAGFFFKIILFFQKLFRTNKTCACGVAHY